MINNLIMFRMASVPLLMFNATALLPVGTSGLLGTNCRLQRVKRRFPLRGVTVPKLPEF
jgi:hypothetical protein